MDHDTGRLGAPLLTEAQIARRVDELAREISEHYRNRELILISILKGSYMFLADLSRRLTIPTRVDFLGLSSYDGTESTGEFRWTARLTTPIEGKHVLLVEDIADSGRTLARVLAHLREEEPASLRVCALLDKPSRRKVPVPLDFVGFTIDDLFVVGYGLDYDGWFRQLPYITVFDPPD